MNKEEDARKRLEAERIANGKITTIEFIPEGQRMTLLGFETDPLPGYCRVCLKLTPSNQSNILVEIWLPTSTWNGNYLGTGNGGSAGQINPLALVNGIRRGYAVANTDMGTSPDPDSLIGLPERWADFGHRATHLMTVAAKQLIKAYYGQAPNHSYFTGGSTGGQQGLMEAQRYPEDYDGILAVAPANNRTHLHMAFVWNWLALTKDSSAAIDTEQAGAITQRIVDTYGQTAGTISGDQFLTHPDRVTVDVDIFRDFLNPAQIDALRKNYEGLVNPETGERIFVPLTVPGSENQPLGLAEQSDRDKFANDFFYLFRWVLGRDFDFTTFDFNRHVDLIDQELAPILNANSADLSAFKKAGGKLILIHGAADPIIPFTDSLIYYQRVIEAQQGIENALAFSRYFLVPGFAHCFGGPGVHEVAGNGLKAAPKDREHDALSALSAWVEEGIAPNRLLAVAFADNNLLNGFLQDDYAYERPVYAYPSAADYVSGDPNNPDNYRIVEYLARQQDSPAQPYTV